MRLVELNKQRAEEEAQGHVRWLRPDYQAPDATQVGAELATKQAEAPQATAPTAKGKATFPKSHPEQLKVLREALASRPHTTESLVKLFKRKPRKSLRKGFYRSPRCDVPRMSRARVCGTRLYEAQSHFLTY